MAGSDGELVGIELMWDTDYWDGPLRGIARYDGQEHYFEAIWDDERDDWTSPRRFLLRRLTPEDIHQERKEHELFERMVSTLNCHHLPREQRRVLTDVDAGAAFYERVGVWDPSRYAERPVVGTFTEYESLTT